MSSPDEWAIPRDFEMDTLSSRWTQCPQIRQDEVFTSWFTRIAKANCADTLGLFHLLLGNSNGSPKSLDNLELLPTLKNTLISHLEPFMEIDPASLKRMPFYLCRKNLSKIGWDYLLTLNPSPKFCPICLKTDAEPFFRDYWHLPFVTVCTRHHTLLLDRCPHCYSPVRYWKTPWDKPITTCFNCHQVLTEENMFIQKPQSRDDMKFQDRLLQVYKTGKYQGQSVHVRYFFQKVWKLASVESVDPEIKEIDKSVCTLSPKRVYKALFLASKVLQNNNQTFSNHTVWNEIDSYPITLRKIFEELRTATHYFQTNGYNPPFVAHHKLPNKFLRIFCNILFDREDLPRAFTTAGGLKGDFGLVWSVYQARQYYKENNHPPYSKYHPFCSISYFCEKGAFLHSGISDWNSFLQKALGNRVTYCGINKNFRSKEGLERACAYLIDYQVKHNRMPFPKEAGLKFLLKAVRRGTWTSFGIYNWQDLLSHVFGANN